MEIRLNCYNSIELNGFRKLKEIKFNIFSFQLKDDKLSGDVKINGEYYKENDEISRGFEDLLPFTLVFRSDNIIIENISVENEVLTFKPGVGIKMNFEIVVNYSINEGLNNNEDIIEVPVEIVEEEMVSNDLNDEMINNEEILNEIETINKQIDDVMEEIILVRENNNYITNSKEDVDFSYQKTSYNLISVYYIKNENELESISKERRIPVQNLYKLNEDYNKTRRIIVHD